MDQVQAPPARRLDGDMAGYSRQLREDGVVHIPGALSPPEVALVEDAFNWKLEHAGVLGIDLYKDIQGARFYQAKGDSSAEPVFARMLWETRIADVVSALFGGGPVWYLEEQLFYKESSATGPGARRTPWHQDLSYQPMQGEKNAVVWIGLDSVPQQHALEVVRKSHKGQIYNAARMSTADDTEPFFEVDSLPRLPNIEAARQDFDIVSWPFEPGDLLVFHSGALHGGGGTPPGGRRRSITLRFVGDDVMKMAFPNTLGALQAPREASPDRPADHLDRFWRLPGGAPVADACLSQVRA